MRHVTKSQRPDFLAIFDNPEDLGSWSNFKGTYRAQYIGLQQKLYEDQRGICAYCEINLILSPTVGSPDFRIEHFHPQSDESANWRYRWDNLFATCSGGSASPIVDHEDRFTAPDLSCDAIKGNTIVDDIAFSPTSPDLSRNIFDFNEEGQMTISRECPDHLVERAQKTIEVFNLSSTFGVSDRLDRLRGGVVDGMRTKVAADLEQGKDIDVSLDELADIFFADNETGGWPAFVSLIQWYLGPAARV